MQAVTEARATLPIRAACLAVGLARATYYRGLLAKKDRRQGRVPRALDALKRQEVLNEGRFAELAPGEVFAMLLDEGRYLCSERTMYRILAEQDLVRERRKQRSHPAYKKPELLATGPNELWSWDISVPQKAA